MLLMITYADDDTATSAVAASLDFADADEVSKVSEDADGNDAAGADDYVGAAIGDGVPDAASTAYDDDGDATSVAAKLLLLSET